MLELTKVAFSEQEPEIRKNRHALYYESGGLSCACAPSTMLAPPGPRPGAPQYCMTVQYDGPKGIHDVNNLGQGEAYFFVGGSGVRD